jgi:hypothetical protein
MKRRFIVLLDGPLSEELRRSSKLSGISESELVRRAVGAFLEFQKQAAKNPEAALAFLQFLPEELPHAS